MNIQENKEMVFHNIIVRNDGMVKTERKGWSSGTRRFGKDGSMYYVVAYNVNGKRMQISVARLVAHLFLGLNLENRNQMALHINRRTNKRCDNSVKNIYIGNNSDNMKDRIKDGTCPLSGRVNEHNPMYGRTGSLNPSSKNMKHYETKHTSISGFKKICKNQGWDYDCFIKKDKKMITRGDGKRYAVYTFHNIENDRYGE